MNKVLFAVFLICLSIIPCNASYYGGHNGGYRQNYGMQHAGMYGNRNYRQPSSGYTYYYRNVEPVPPNYDKNGVKIPPKTISCLGTSSYRKIGDTYYACSTAAASRIKVKYKDDKVSSNNKRYGM